MPKLPTFRLIPKYTRFTPNLETEVTSQCKRYIDGNIDHMLVHFAVVQIFVLISDFQQFFKICSYTYVSESYLPDETHDENTFS